MITYLIALLHKKTPVYAEIIWFYEITFFTYHEIKISIILCRHIYNYQTPSVYSIKLEPWGTQYCSALPISYVLTMDVLSLLNLKDFQKRDQRIIFDYNSKVWNLKMMMWPTKNDVKHSQKYLQISKFLI